eukprot:TRINITY_DN1171_c0_g1_i1.p1 TRINITY_DN1171_c0_g1~~TRINITY_DN1171_c0_g1_i1.p1  ORF type:complete len:170 (-),score=48.67 TRINITY_DN1171_c0_g1_i1:103-612(-)
MKVSVFVVLACILSYARYAHAATNVTMTTTSYGYDDNSPPSAEIAFPHSDGYPTLHNLATETNGTYGNPITFATNKAEYKPGTIVYVVHLRKYFIMEDECGDCDADWKKGKHHIDLWMGPQHTSSSGALNDCEDKVTRDNAIVIVDPPNNLPVETTLMFQNNQCTVKLF